ncbi:Sugar phosphate permease [Pacificibacter marinus]|uniref:Putative 3-hydroxyphenylpropionic transporter MhpT n=2 Tax=Pacificibacter marinus TaxID=658057 RepID=A0A1Y5SYW2_9RHOB|nr:Sugar phosphate permease [Pacificibacter marinus]SLN51908.1 putative 3-hydroxyphenylpropionic transporter MhpT [Pacificibacter marinus]
MQGVHERMSYVQFIYQNIRWLSVGFLLCLTSSYGQTYFISIFAGEIRTEFGLSHTAWGWIYSAGTMASAALMVWAGTLTDRFRVRVLAPIILTLLAVACLAMAAAPTALSLVFVIFALRFTGQGMTFHISMVGMARWFQATRGRALSIASLGLAVGNAVLPLIFVSLMFYFSWRQLWLIAAVLSIFLVPLIISLLREERTPQSISKSSTAVGMNGIHWTRGAMLKHWLFWMCLPLLLGPPIWGTSMFFQQVSYVDLKGWDLFDFVALFPLMTLGSVTFNFLSGMAVDKWGAGRILPLMLIPFGIGFIMLALSTTLTMASFSLIVVGIGMGSQGPVAGAFWAESYGTKNIGAIKATAAAFMVFGSAIGPGVSGALIDKGVDMQDQLVGYGIYIFASAVLAYFATQRAQALLPTTTQIDIVST